MGQEDELNKYFREQTNQRLERMEHKIDSLLEFKWKAAGGLTIFNVIVIAVLQIFFH